MTDRVQNSRQFDMNRGLSKEEKLSRAQQAAQQSPTGCRKSNPVRGRNAWRTGPCVFNFEAVNDDVKTVSKNKKVGDRATNSVSGKTFAEDVFSGGRTFCQVNV